MSSLKQKGFKAFIWDFLGQISNQLISFVISIVLARILNPSDFGQIAMINVIIGFSSVFMDAGLGVALIQKKEINENEYGTVFFFNITTGLILALLLFFSSNLIASFYHKQELVSIAKSMSLLFIFNSFGNVIRVKLRKEFNNKVLVKSRLFSAFICGIVGITLAFTGFGVWSLVLQGLLNPVLVNLYIFTSVKWRPKLVFNFESLKNLWGFGFKMFLSGILDGIFVNLDSVVIGRLFSSVKLGHYYRSRSLNSLIIQYSSSSLMQVLFPLLATIQDDVERVKHVVRKSVHLLSFASFFLVSFFYITGSDIIIILFGSKWEPAIPYFKIIILSAYGYPFSSLLVNILSSTGNSKAFLQLEIVTKASLALNFIIGFYYGIEGYLYGYAVWTVFATWASILFAAKQLRVSQSFFIKNIYPYVLICIISILTFNIMNVFIIKNIYIHVIISGFLGVILFFVQAYLFKVEGLEIIMHELLSLKKKKNISL